MKQYGFNPEILNKIKELGSDILESELFQQEKNFIQHGTTTTFDHSLSVTYVSVKLAMKYKMKVDMRSLIRAALLHDYFLYDWHEKHAGHWNHGYTHAAESLRNAKRDFKLNRREEKVIYSHMFPLNLTHVPTCKEAWLVTMADKICASGETFKIASYTPEPLQLICEE